MALLALLIALLLLLLGDQKSVQGMIKNQVFPAVIGFGDSILDTGNNNFLPTIAKSNFPPYGKDFIDHRPTGRFSNGKVPVDLLASGFGIKEILPAYLSPELTDEDLPTGVCFASGGSGFDPLTSKLTSAISLGGQLELFNNYKKKLKVVVGDERGATIINDSLYVICTGNNDVANTYYGTILRISHYTFTEYAKFLVQSASEFIQELYNSGARRIIVVGLPPLGCIPSQRTVAGGINRDCVTLFNEDSEYYNYELSLMLQVLNNKLQMSKIIYVDIYQRLTRIIQNYKAYGFEVANLGCCGTGEYEAAVFCNSIVSRTCANDSKYVFWDGFHPTQKAYEILINEIIQEDVPLLF